MGSVDDVDSVHEDMPDNKRQKRNSSEKRRRDAFNKLITELHGIVTTGDRKLDKSNVLKQTITYLQNNNQSKPTNRAAVRPDKWKPAFLSHEEYACLMLEGLGAFVLVLSNSGNIIFASNQLKHLTGSSNKLKGMSFLDFLDHPSAVQLRSILSGEVLRAASGNRNGDQLVRKIELKLNVMRTEQRINAGLVLTGKFKRIEISGEEAAKMSLIGLNLSPANDMLCFVCVGRLKSCLALAPSLASLPPSPAQEKVEFTACFNMEWRFISLDSKAFPLLGYIQMEVLGNSGYDYYHPDDLDQIVEDHLKLKEQKQVVFRPYRFLTKGRSWIRLEGRAFITRDQWNTGPDFVVSVCWAVKEEEMVMEEPASVSSSVVLSKPRLAMIETGAKKFRPQPGVSIEHSPIPRASPRTRLARSDSTLVQASRAEEGEDQQVYQELQQRQSNLQQQIQQQKQELMTLQQQLLRSSEAPFQPDYTPQLETLHWPTPQQTFHWTPRSSS